MKTFECTHCGHVWRGRNESVDYPRKCGKCRMKRGIEVEGNPELSKKKSVEEQPDEEQQPEAEPTDAVKPQIFSVTFVMLSGNSVEFEIEWQGTAESLGKTIKEAIASGEEAAFKCKDGAILYLGTKMAKSVDKVKIEVVVE